MLYWERSNKRPLSCGATNVHYPVVCSVKLPVCSVLPGLACSWMDRRTSMEPIYSQLIIYAHSFGKQSHAFHIGSLAWRGRTGAYKERWRPTSEFPWPVMEGDWDQPTETTELLLIEPIFLFTSQEDGIICSFVVSINESTDMQSIPSCHYGRNEYRTEPVFHIYHRIMTYFSGSFFFFVFLLQGGQRPWSVTTICSMQWGWNVQFKNECLNLEFTEQYLC